MFTTVFGVSISRTVAGNGMFNFSILFQFNIFAPFAFFLNLIYIYCIQYTFATKKIKIFLKFYRSPFIRFAPFKIANSPGLR